MKAVMLQVPEALLEERRRQGADRWDEIWEGVLHMVPPPAERHQNLGMRLGATLLPLADRRGLKLSYEIGLYRTTDDYRVPDLAVYRPDQASARGIEQSAELVIEIRSPGDETTEKLPWYTAQDVCEILVIDRDTLVVDPTHSEVLGCTFETFETVDGPVLQVTHEGGSIAIVL
ncbi:MAG: Uma2 family endonuclease [Acidimicrobiales bacterium]